MTVEIMASAAGFVVLGIVGWIFHSTGQRAIGNGALALSLSHLWLMAVLPMPAISNEGPSMRAAAFVAGNESDWYHLPGSPCVAKLKRPLVPLRDEAEAMSTGRCICPACRQWISALVSMPRITQTSTRPMPASRYTHQSLGKDAMR